MDQVTSTGVTGSKAKFTIDLQQHSLSFTTKLQVRRSNSVVAKRSFDPVVTFVLDDVLQVAEANLPPEANIPLPHVHVAAEYITDSKNPMEATFAGNDCFHLSL